MKNHRDEMLGFLPPETQMWCSHCERTYLHGEFRVGKDRMPMPGMDNVLQLCPYEDCDADAVFDSKEWSWVRENCSEYPDIPESNTVYPL